MRRKAFSALVLVIFAVPVFGVAAHGVTKAEQWRASAARAPSAPAHIPPGIARYNAEVTGPFAGTAFFTFGANGCSFVYVQLDGTYTTSANGTGTVHVAGCADSADVVGGFEFIGLFTIVTPGGATVSGTARGPVFPLDFALSVVPTPGSGPFSAIGGTIDFTASSVSGDVTGALTGALQPTVHPHPERPTSGAINKVVSGSFAGSAFFTFGENGCSFAYEQFDGTYTTSSGTQGTLHIAGCADFADVPGGFLFAGTYTLVTPTGVTLTGDASGPVFPVDLTLVVTSTSATGGRFNGTGTIEFTASGISNDITGSLTGSLKSGG